MTSNPWIAVLLLVVSAVLQACAGLTGGADSEALRTMLAEVVDKPTAWLQTPEGQAYFQNLVAKYAPAGFDPALLGTGAATGLAGLLVGLRALITGEKKDKASRKRGEMWAEITEAKKA